MYVVGLLKYCVALRLARGLLTSLEFARIVLTCSCAQGPCPAGTQANRVKTQVLFTNWYTSKFLEFARKSSIINNGHVRPGTALFYILSVSLAYWGLVSTYLLVHRPHKGLGSKISVLPRAQGSKISVLRQNKYATHHSGR
jgi:hypothetical protein